MGAQALRWDFSGGLGANVGGESLFGNDFEEVAASAAATSATASWLPPGASMRPPPEDTASPSASVFVAKSSLVSTVGTLQPPASLNVENSRKSVVRSSKRRGRSEGGERRSGRGECPIGGKAPPPDAMFELSKSLSKSPSWDPEQSFVAQYGDSFSGRVVDGENSMQDMSLSLLNMSLDDETLDALGLTH